jgi:SsrA-binding protein
MAKAGKKKEKKLKEFQIRNKKAFKDYEILEKVEAGISLTGSEVKSLRQGKGDLAGAYGRLANRECFLIGASIAVYENTGYVSHEPVRDRKLLLHKKQIIKIKHKLDQKGFTLVPLRIYFNSRGLAKVEIALARGWKKYDKREKLTKQTHRREINY